MKQSLYTVLVFTKLNTKRFFRDKVAIFFGILFPLIFLFVFGGLFGDSGSNVSFKVALINQSDSGYAKEFADSLRNNKIFDVDDTVTTESMAEEKMNRSQIDATIFVPSEFGAEAAGQPSGQLKVLYTQNNAQAGQVLTSALQDGFKELNSRFATVDLPFTVQGEQLNKRSLSQFDYTFAGLLGFAIIGLGIFGPVNIFPELKKQGILRRLHTTPLRVWQYFLSIVASQVIQGLLSIAIMFTVAITLFDLKVAGNLFEIAIFLVLSIAMILGIGLALGGWAKNERQAAPLSNIIVFPMMFLSGTFFPRFLMPEWLQNVSAFLPLTPVIDGIRLMATEGQGLVQLWPQVGMIAVWLVLIYLIAFRVFRWE